MSDHKIYPAADRVVTEMTDRGMALRVYENSRTVHTEAILTQEEAWEVARRLANWTPFEVRGVSVDPLPTIRFHDGTRQEYDVPRNTLDPRLEACTYHHPACDCREAELSEQIAEHRGGLKVIADAARDVLAGHAIWAYEDGPNGERSVGCMCTGCQIVRAGYVLPSMEGSSYARDEIDGLSPDEVEFGRRWKVCTDRGGACHLKYRTRDRGHYHEHLTESSGKLVPLLVDLGEPPF